MSAARSSLERYQHTERDWGGSGRYIKSAPCDGCGKPVGTNYFTDGEVCGGSDGPGFYLCERKRCITKRSGLSIEAQGHRVTAPAWLTLPTGARAYIPPGSATPCDGATLRALAYAGQLPPDPDVVWLAANFPEAIPRDVEPTPAPQRPPSLSTPRDVGWVDGCRLSRPVRVF